MNLLLWKALSSLAFVLVVAGIVRAQGNVRLHVQPQTTIALIRTCAETCRTDSVPVFVTGVGAVAKLQFSMVAFDKSSNVSTVGVTPAEVTAGVAGGLAVKLTFDVEKNVEAPVTGQLLVRSGTDVAAVLLKIENPPPMPKTDTGAAERRRLVEMVLKTSLGWSSAFVFALFVALFWITRNGSYPFKGMGLATVDQTSWASATSVLATASGVLLGIPPSLGLTKFVWALDLSIIAGIALLLTTLSPLVFNLTRHFVQQGELRVQVNWIFVFLLSAVGTITGVLAAGHMLWYENADLMNKKVISAGVGKGIEFGLWVMLVALTVYFAVSIIEIVSIQVKITEAVAQMESLQLSPVGAEEEKRRDALENSARTIINTSSGLRRPWSVL